MYDKCEKQYQDYVYTEISVGHTRLEYPYISVEKTPLVVHVYPGRICLRMDWTPQCLTQKEVEPYGPNKQFSYAQNDETQIESYGPNKQLFL